MAAKGLILPALGLTAAASTLALPVLSAMDLAWMPSLVVVALIGWRRRVRVAFALAGIATALVLLGPGFVIGDEALPLAAIWLLALTSLRSSPGDDAADRARLAAALEDSELVTLVIDASGRVSYANHAFLALARMELDALVGRPVIDLVASGDRPILGERLVEAAQRSGGELLRIPRLCLALGDEPVYLQARLSRIEDGPEQGSVVLSGTEITEQVQAESALAGSETRFASLFATSRDALLITRADDRRVLDFNDAFTQLTGWRRDEGVGQSVDALLRLADEADRERIAEHLERDGAFADFECAAVRRDGRVVELALSGRYADIDGARCVVAVLRDLTENRRTQTALAESQEKFARIFHRSPDAMSIVRLSDEVVIDANDRFASIQGRPHERIVGRTLRSLEADRDGPGLSLEWLRDATADEADREIDLEIPGGRVPALVSTTVAEINGEPCAISMIKDMSELRKARRDLLESEERFRGAFEHAPIGMMLLRPDDGRIGQVNRVLCELLGYEEEALVGRDPLTLVPEKERGEERHMLEALLEGKELTEDTRESRYLRRDGRPVWTQRQLVVQRAPDGTPVRIIMQITDATDLRERRERMERLAFYDTLTGLANRRLFADRLQQAVRHAVRTGRPSALLYLDLDKFKRVNDSLGHEAGDQLLREVARRLLGCVRSEDTVSRFGGDEFTVLLNESGDGRGASRVAREILDALKQPIALGGHEFRVTTSIGITLTPDDGTDPQTLLKNADLAMYRAKERGRDNYQFFSEDLNTRAMDRLIIENELRMALAREEFELYFQPQICLESGTITGLEALLRWHHPERGLLTPDRFIRTAEESGLIVPLGDWTLRAACARMRELQLDTGVPLRMAVNVSARQFADPRLPSTVAKALAETKLDASTLELEITETMLADDVEEAIGTLSALRELGVSLAVDDFGTGYSSLQHLKRLPIDRVKVDRAFVSGLPGDEDDVAITSAIVAMARQLQLEVVAEGVETQAQLDFLAAAGCKLAQGYLIGAPVPWTDVERAVAALLDPASTAGKTA